MPGDFDFDDDADRPRRRAEYADRSAPGTRSPKNDRFPVLILALAGGGVMFLAIIVVVLLVVRKATRDTQSSPASSGTVVAASTPIRPASTTPAKKEPDPLSNSPTPEVVEKVKKATVLVRVRFNNGKGGSGTGFVEKESRLVLTNAHVVGMVDPKDRGPRTIELVVNSGDGPGKEYSLGGELIAADAEADLALIRPFLLRPGERHIVPEGLSVPKAQSVSLLQRLFVFGYPFGEKLGNEITVAETSISSLRKDRSTGKLAQIQVKGGMNPGNSGGPVVDVRGNVVGVAQAGIVGTDINFAIPGEVVQEFIARKRN